jgi:hypothetical protein
MDENEVPKTSFKNRTPYAVLAVLIILALAAGGVAWYWFKLAPETVAMVPDAGAPATVDAGTEAGADLAEGEQLAKSSLADLVPKAWLEGGDTIRRVAAAVSSVSEGQSPRPVMLVLQPEGDFAVDEKKEVVKKGRKRVTHSTYFVSEKNDARYDTVTKAFTAIDAAAVGRIYGKLRPYLETAFREIARPGKTFDGTFTSAVDRLASVPITDGPREVVPMAVGTGYAWKDPKLEALSPAEKHLLRMGPKNARAIVQQLKAFRASMNEPAAATKP